jgi:hypothetical protein
MGDVRESVIHPTHVPLQVEAETADPGRASHLWPRGRLLGHHQRSWMLVVDRRIELAQKLDRLQILPSPVLVRDPLGSRVIQVEHRSHRVDAQTIDVKLLQPIQGARYE